VDLYPTVCEMAGLETPSGREGTSLVPLFDSPSRPWKTAAFSQFPRGYFNRFMGCAMRTDRYRYVEWRDRLDNRLLTSELYDHETDHMENENIAEYPENAGLVKQLAKQLAEGWPAARPKR
jgi:iduronate 2-sulfatase